MQTRRIMHAETEVKNRTQFRKGKGSVPCSRKFLSIPLLKKMSCVLSEIMFILLFFLTLCIVMDRARFFGTRETNQNQIEAFVWSKYVENKKKGRLNSDSVFLKSEKPGTPNRSQADYVLCSFGPKAYPHSCTRSTVTLSDSGTQIYLLLFSLR